MPGDPNKIVVLGGSAGGLKAVMQIVAALDAKLPAAVFIVLHLGAEPAPSLATRLAKAGSLDAAFAKDGEPIEAGRLYIAPPDHHLLIQANSLRLSHGPRVNRARPAIDLTLRSAAVAYGSRAIGVVLSGMLDDGTAGLVAIRRCGGTALVQDPADALYADMPRSALAYTDADHTLPASAMGPLLNQLARAPVMSTSDIPNDLALENRFDLNTAGGVTPPTDQLGSPVSMGCPECGGPLSEINQGPLRYRCRIGHSLSARNMLVRQDEEIERTLWVALRTLEEQARVQMRLAQREQNSRRRVLMKSFQQRADETAAHAERLRKLLLEIGHRELSPEESSEPS